MYRNLFLFVVAVSVISCVKKDKIEVDVSDIEANAQIARFDQAFYTTPPSELPSLKNKFPYLFPVQTPDSIWVAKMQDEDEQELFAETEKVFKDIEDIKSKLNELFRHVKYYYPTFNEPKVITLLNNVDYESSVVYADSLLFVSLDNFLGTDSKIYQDFPEYLRTAFTKDHIPVRVAEVLALREIPRAKSRTFVSRMVQEGKLLYMIDAFLPQTDNATKIGYTKDQLEWADFNDVEVWKYFVQNELLFSTDQELPRRFIENAPFSKFYSENDAESPGKIGVWYGWQIVKAFMKNNDATLQEMLRTDNEEIFKKSKYKPTK